MVVAVTGSGGVTALMLASTLASTVEVVSTPGVNAVRIWTPPIYSAIVPGAKPASDVPICSVTVHTAAAAPPGVASAITYSGVHGLAAMKARIIWSPIPPGPHNAEPCAGVNTWVGFSGSSVPVVSTGTISRAAAR